MNYLAKPVKFFIRRPLWQYVLLAALALSFFAYLAASPTFVDPDSFYHAKMAQLLVERGTLTDFPWLTATTLRYHFIDHHWLYHLLLIPFVNLWPPLYGLKVATVLLATGTILAIFWLLRSLKIKGAFWFALFLLTVNPFIFRLNLAKATALVLILVFLAIYLIFNRRYFLLLFLSAAYVWAYGGWPLAGFLVLAYCVISCLWALSQRGFLAMHLGQTSILKQNFWLLLSVFTGLAAGFFFSPYFPQNIYFYWQQIFKIALVNYQSVIGVGGEWYPYPPGELLGAAAPFFALLFIALLSFAWSYRKQPLHAWFFLFMTLVFCGLTLKSRRYVEYFVPFGAVFSALSLNVLWQATSAKFTRYLPRNFFIGLMLALIIGGLPLFYQDMKLLKNAFTGGFAFDRFAAASAWLENNSEPGDIVFHSDWDEFPLLFFHNDSNYYLVGLDPTFMYEFDRDLHQRWVAITTGKSADNMYQNIKQAFGAQYVFVDYLQNGDFDRNLSNNFNFEVVYSDAEAKIYKVAE